MIYLGVNLLVMIKINSFIYSYDNKFIKNLKRRFVKFDFSEKINETLNTESIKGISYNVDISLRKKILIHIKNSIINEQLLYFDIWQMRKFHKKLSKIYAANNKDLKKDIAFLKLLEKLFNYSNFRSKHSSNLACICPIRTCYYCNTIHTARSIQGEKIYFEFDHYLPKSIYPYFSASYKNLIPSCSNCNKAKRAADPFYSDKYIPYPYDTFFNRSLNEQINFKYKLENSSLVQRINGNRSINLCIDINPGYPKNVILYLKKFGIENLILFHNYIINELVDNVVIYSTILVDNEKEDVYKELFQNNSDIFRFVFGVEKNRDLILNRPFGKLLYDLAIDLSSYWNVL